MWFLTKVFYGAFTLEKQHVPARIPLNTPHLSTLACTCQSQKYAGEATVGSSACWRLRSPNQWITSLDSCCISSLLVGSKLSRALLSFLSLWKTFWCMAVEWSVVTPLICLAIPDGGCCHWASQSAWPHSRCCLNDSVLPAHHSSAFPGKPLEVALLPLI